MENLPINYALLQLVSTGNSNNYNENSSTTQGGVDVNCGGIAPPSVQNLSPDDLKCYKLAKLCIENLALHLKSFLVNGNFGSLLTRPMLRKLVTLVNCQLMEEEGRARALRAARSLGDRTVTELILQHQNPQQLSSNLWAAVRSRGCQFLGPAMQEEVLKLVLLALEDGTALSRKVLVMFVVQRLEPHFPQASKTSIGHVVQLLYRASCFKVSKREADSSLMQLKEEFRTYDALRREHDAQIVQIATEAGLRIAPDQWSSLLYGDTIHKSHMQSIMDKLQTPQSFAQSVQELVIALQRTGDPAKLSGLRTHFKHLASIDPTVENVVPTWQEVAKSLDAVRQVVIGLVEFVQHHGNRKLQECSQVKSNTKYKISLCRDLTVRRICPRGSSCTFAHSEEELERYRAKNRKNNSKDSSSTSSVLAASSSSSCTQNPLSVNISGPGTSSKKGTVEFQPHPTMHHNHHHLNPLTMKPNTTLLHSDDINQQPSTSSTSTSPMRFIASSSSASTTKLLRGNGCFDELGGGSVVKSPLHQQLSSVHHHNHQMRPMHQSPVNGGMIGSQLTQAPPPINVPPRHLFEPPYGTIPINYSIPRHSQVPSAAPPTVGLKPSGMPNLQQPLINANGGILSPRHYSNTLLQQTMPPPPVASINPPQYHANNVNSMSNPNKSLYNTLPTDFFNSNLINSSMQQQQQPNPRSPSFFNSQTQDFIGLVPNDISGNKLRPPLPPNNNMLWEQRQQLLNGLDKLSLAGKQTQYGKMDANAIVVPFNDKKTTCPTQNKSLNEMSGHSNDNYIFKNSTNNNTQIIHATRDEILTGIGGSLAPNFWNSESTNNPNVATNLRDDSVANHGPGIGCEVGGGGGGGSSFRDRDSFVRSDSILYDDATTFDVPTTSVSLVNKFGPICPNYKGLNTDTSTSNNYLDRWNNAPAKASNKIQNSLFSHDEHPLLESNDQSPTSGDVRHSVFPDIGNSGNSNENTMLLLQQHLQQHNTISNPNSNHNQQKNSGLDDYVHMQAALSKLSGIQFCINSSEVPDHLNPGGSNGSKNFEFGFGYKLQMIGSGVGDDSGHGIEKVSHTVF